MLMNPQRFTRQPERRAATPRSEQCLLTGSPEAWTSRPVANRPLPLVLMRGTQSGQHPGHRLGGNTQPRADFLQGVSVA